MRTIVHLSDLHFGRLDERLLEPLRSAIGAAQPDLIAISGDLTQRALTRQFRAARGFLDSLRYRMLIVPGNHDVPLYNIAARIVAPLSAYRRFISADLGPSFIDSEIAVVGLNTARAWVRRGGGRLNDEQVARAIDRFGRTPPGLVKIIVTHHPFDLPAGVHEHHLVGRAHRAMEHLARAGADLFLAGHLHLSHIGHTAERYKIEDHAALVIQAGTLSTRGRGEANTFNVIRVQPPDIVVERHSWDREQERFVRAKGAAFRRTMVGWQPLAGSG